MPPISATLMATSSMPSAWGEPGLRQPPSGLPTPGERRAASRAGWPEWLHAGVLLLWAVFAPLAHADCSRLIRAPVSPASRLVIVEGERVSGVWPDLLRQLGADIGCSFEFPVLPRARIEMELLAGQRLDVMAPATQTPQRDRHALFVPLLHQPLMLLTRNADVGKVASLAALRRSGWRTAALRSFAFSAEYRALIAELAAEHRVDYVNDPDAVGRMLRAGRIDFALLPPSGAFSALDKSLSQRRFDALPLLEVGAYLSTHTLAPADLALLREALVKASKDGRVRRAFARYYPPEVVELAQP